MIALPWNTTRSHRYGGNGFTVNSNSDKKEQAAQFTIEMATDWDVQHVYAETAGQPAYETLEHIEQVKDPWFQTLHLIATRGSRVSRNVNDAPRILSGGQAGTVENSRFFRIGQRRRSRPSF